MSNVKEFRTEDNLWGWQSQTATVAERAKHALYTEAFADITFQFPSDEGSVTSIKAHKSMLAMGSAVFETMFYGSIAETRDTIPISDIDVEVFRIMLRYIYHDQIGPFDINTAFPSLYTAKKYGISILKNAAFDYLKKNITVENCVYWLIQAQQYAEEEMQHLCMELIDSKGSLVLKSETFLQIGLPLLKLILCRDTLNVTETEVYTAAIRWAANQCVENSLEDCGTNYRIVLDDALGMIRFPVMTLEETAAAAESGMLSADQLSELFLWFGKRKQPSKFIARQRQVVTDPTNGRTASQVTVCRFQKPYEFTNYPRRFGLSGPNPVNLYRDIIKFSVVSAEHGPGFKTLHKDYVINLTGFGVIVKDRHCRDASYNVSAKIHTMDVERFEESWVNDARSQEMEIEKCMFSKPFPITLNTEYQLWVEITGMSSAFISMENMFTDQLTVLSAGSCALKVRFNKLRLNRRELGFLDGTGDGSFGKLPELYFEIANDTKSSVSVFQAFLLCAHIYSTTFI